MLKICILSSIFLISISCSNEQKVENQIYDCLNVKIKERPIGSSEDFFIYLREMELFSIKNGYLLDSTMGGYLSFFKNMYYQENQAKKVRKNIDKYVSNNFLFNLGLIHTFYKDCHMGLEVTNNESINKVNRKLKIYDSLELKGFDDYESIIMLINDTNFQNEKDRLMLFNIIQIFASSRGNPR